MDSHRTDIARRSVRVSLPPCGDHDGVVLGPERHDNHEIIGADFVPVGAAAPPMPDAIPSEKDVSDVSFIDAALVHRDAGVRRKHDDAMFEDGT